MNDQNLPVEAMAEVVEESGPVSQLTPIKVDEVKAQVAMIQELMSSVMKEGINNHYGKIPGTTKLTLLKPGAEKLGFMFRLAPEFEVEVVPLGGDHRECRVKCTLRSINNGAFWGEGLGSCSTMESKYRYRKSDADYEVLEADIPKDYKERKREYRRQGYGCKKLDNGAWVWVKFGDSAQVENPDIADTYNTVLKMARKRAHIDAILTATAGSDIFTQDMDDFVDVEMNGAAGGSTVQTPRATQAPKISNRGIPDKAFKAVFAAAREKGIPEQWHKDVIAEMGLGSRKDMTMEQFEAWEAAVAEYEEAPAGTD